MPIFQTELSSDYFKRINSTPDFYRWEDIETDRVRILSKERNPFNKPIIIVPSLSKYRSDSTRYIAHLQLKVRPIEKGKQYPISILNREYIKTHFPYTKNSLFAASFPTSKPLHWISYEFLPLPKQLYLIRGASGSGKTTLGQALAANRVISADDFPGLYREGTYQLDLQQESHNWCLQETELSLKNGYTIAVANTFSRKKHLQPYLELAYRYNYQVTVITCEGNHGNTHGVTEEIRNRQLATFEPLESLGIKGLEIRLTDALRNHEITAQQLHEMIDNITQTLSETTPQKPFAQPVTARSDSPRGTGEFNENKNNDQRIQESINLVKEAVEYLKETGQWSTEISKRDRIALIQKYTQEKYQRTISSGTLYQDWCKSFWS